MTKRRDSKKCWAFWNADTQKHNDVENWKIEIIVLPFQQCNLNRIIVFIYFTILNGAECFDLDWLIQIHFRSVMFRSNLVVTFTQVQPKFLGRYKVSCRRFWKNETNSRFSNARLIFDLGRANVRVIYNSVQTFFEKRAIGFLSHFFLIVANSL